MSAGRNASLIAEDEIRLLAAQDRYSLASSNKGSSASLGVSFSLGAQTGVSLTASASQSRGRANGEDTLWSNTKVSAGNTAQSIRNEAREKIYTLIYLFWTVNINPGLFAGGEMLCAKSPNFS